MHWLPLVLMEVSPLTKHVKHSKLHLKYFTACNIMSADELLEMEKPCSAAESAAYSNVLPSAKVIAQTTSSGNPKGEECYSSTS